MILLDTHVVVWLGFDPQLSKKARTAINDARQNGGGLGISDTTLLELAVLSSKGRIRLNISLEAFLRRFLARVPEYVLPARRRTAAAAIEW